MKNIYKKALIALTAFGFVVSPISPALAVDGEPVPHYLVSDSGYFPKEIGTSYDIYNFQNQMIQSSYPYASFDMVRAYQGDNIVYNPLKNDNPGNPIPEGHYASEYHFEYDPNAFDKIFDYSSMTISVAGSDVWTTSIDSPRGFTANVIPAEGTTEIKPVNTNDPTSPAYNPYNMPLIAITSDPGTITSEVILYRVNILDKEGNYISTLEGSSYVGLAERTESYCYSPDSGFSSQLDILYPWRMLDHDEFFDPANYLRRGNTAGSGGNIDCGANITGAEATVNSGERIFIPLDNSITPYNTFRDFERGSSNYFTDTSTVVLNDVAGNDNGDTLITEDGVWEKTDGGVFFTPAPTATNKTVTQTIDISTRWNSPDPRYAPYIEYMNKRIGVTVKDVPITVQVVGITEEVPVEEVPVEEVPEETPVEEVPEETPIEEVPEETPIEEIPEETPVVEEEEPVIPVVEEEEPVIPVVPEETPVVEEAPVVVQEATPTAIKDGGESNFLLVLLASFGGAIALFGRKLFATK